VFGRLQSARTKGSEGLAVRERVKIFTLQVGNEDAVVGSHQENEINQWLSAVKGRVVQVTQSESPRGTAAHHVTVCIWYLPEVLIDEPPAT
jgi:hypothetical protein